MKKQNNVIFQVALTEEQFEEFKDAVIEEIKNVTKEQNEIIKECFRQLLQETKSKNKIFEEFKKEDEFLKEDAKKLFKLIFR